MKTLFAVALALMAGQSTPPGTRQQSVDIPGVGRVLYAVTVPSGYDASRPAPLVVSLHSGGERMRYYGSAFTNALVQPGLSDLKAIILSPDCPAASWADPAADGAVMALVEQTLSTYSIDRRRILVTGFSMGGRGTWYMASHHKDLFTAAIPMAASVGSEPLEDLATMPTFVIHSRQDEVVPFAPAERLARDLADRGRTIRFLALDGFTHFQMFRYVDALRQGGKWVAAEWQRQ